MSVNGWTIGVLGLGFSVLGAIFMVVRALLRKPLSKGWIFGLVLLFAGSTVALFTTTMDVVISLSSGGTDEEGEEQDSVVAGPTTTPP